MSEDAPSHLDPTPLGLAPAVPSLEYGRASPRRRLRKRHLVVASLLIACVSISWGFGRSARDNAQNLLYARQAARHVEPANTIVFESDPVIAQALIDAGTHRALSRESPAPAVLVEPDSFSIFRGAIDARALELGALVFLHELTTPSGARRVVVVQFLPHYLDGQLLPGAGLVAHVFEPGGFLREPEPLGRSHAKLLIPVDAADVEVPEAPVDDTRLQWAQSSGAAACVGLTSPVLRETFDPWGRMNDSLRWYAGQPDELDPSHFTIDYEIGGVRGTIDGYLSDDGRHVRMHARPHHVSGPGNGMFQRVAYPT